MGRLSSNCESGRRLIMKFLSVIATSLCLAGRASASTQTRRTFLVLNSGDESTVGIQKYSRGRCDVSVSVSWVLQYVWSAVFGDLSFLHWIHSAHDGRESRGHDPPLAPRLRIQRVGFRLSQAWVTFVSASISLDPLQLSQNLRRCESRVQKMSAMGVGARSSPVGDLNEYDTPMSTASGACPPASHTVHIGPRRAGGMRAWLAPPPGLPLAQ